MHWLRLQLPVLYLASILLAGGVPCAAHAAADQAATAAHHEHAHHDHHATHEAPEIPCHAGEAVCGCETLAEQAQTAVAAPRGEKATPALAADSAAAGPRFHLSRIGKPDDPPGQHSLRTLFYDEIHGRAARLLI